MSILIARVCVPQSRSVKGAQQQAHPAPSFLHHQSHTYQPSHAPSPIQTRKADTRTCTRQNFPASSYKYLASLTLWPPSPFLLSSRRLAVRRRRTAKKKAAMHSSWIAQKGSWKQFLLFDLSPLFREEEFHPFSSLGTSPVVVSRRRRARLVFLYGRQRREQLDCHCHHTRARWLLGSYSAVLYYN